MTDITPVRGANRRAPETRGTEADQSQASVERDELIACVELFFFAYRDFTADPDAVLEQYGFGRAHHRVLHFVHRNPGLRVANLLEILQITKQSLARVLKQLIDESFIAQRPGPNDRRERLLYVTAKGGRLAEKLMSLQVKRVADALGIAGPGADAAARRFLLAMIGEREQTKVETLIRSSTAGARAKAGSP